MDPHTAAFTESFVEFVLALNAVPPKLEASPLERDGLIFRAIDSLPSAFTMDTGLAKKVAAQVWSRSIVYVPALVQSERVTVQVAAASPSTRPPVIDISQQQLAEQSAVATTMVALIKRCGSASKAHEALMLEGVDIHPTALGRLKTASYFLNPRGKLTRIISARAERLLLEAYDRICAKDAGVVVPKAPAMPELQTTGKRQSESKTQRSARDKLAGVRFNKHHARLENIKKLSVELSTVSAESVSARLGMSKALAEELLNKLHEQGYLRKTGRLYARAMVSNGQSQPLSASSTQTQPALNARASYTSSATGTDGRAVVVTPAMAAS